MVSNIRALNTWHAAPTVVGSCFGGVMGWLGLMLGKVAGGNEHCTIVHKFHFKCLGSLGVVFACWCLKGFNCSFPCVQGLVVTYSLVWARAKILYC